MIDLSKKLCSLSKSLHVSYTLHSKPISYEEVFSETGLLPALAKRADQLCTLCLGYGIGASFTDVDKTTLGVKVQFDEITPNVLRLLCLYDVLYELIKISSGDKVSLDELMYD